MNWYDWMIGRDRKSACRDFLAYVHKILSLLCYFPICSDVLMTDFVYFEQ